MNPKISHAKAKAALEAVFAALGHSLAAVPLAIRKPTAGKVYEITVLAEVLVELRGRGFFLAFSNPGAKIELKGGPGMLDHNDPHFDVATTLGGKPIFEVFVSVEFRTMGSASAAKTDLSDRHEIDIGVFDAGSCAYPSHKQVALAVECKAVTPFTKALVRGVLGLRRELSLLSEPQPSKLAMALGKSVPVVPAEPASEVWLVASDSQVTSYKASPEHYGVVCKHIAA